MLKFKVKKGKSTTEKSLSDNQSETGNTDSTEEIDINVTTKLFMKKFKSMEFHRDRPKNCSQSNLSEAKIKAKRLKTSKSISY